MAPPRTSITRGITRTTLRGASLLLILSAATIVVLWIRSYRQPEAFIISHADGRTAGFGSNQGKVLLVLTNLRLRGNDPWHVDLWNPDRATYHDLEERLMNTPRIGRIWPADWARWGPDDRVSASFEASGIRRIGLIHPLSQPGAWSLSILLPHWAVVISLLLPVVILRAPAISNALRQRRRRKLRLCEFCGYDIRASNINCPECGAPIPHPPSVLPTPPETIPPPPR